MRLTFALRKAGIKLSRDGVLEMDYLRVYVRGGTGGNGLVKFGGVGGNGGNVVFKASPRVSLLQLATIFPERRFIGQVGKDSRKLVILGSSGKDYVLKVPVGVTISSDDGRKLGELDKEGDEIIVARGGEGGSSKRQDYAGERPEGRSLRLDLKLLADIGLVGFPNAGKSTLLKAISKAQPKIANYPFTTLKPQLGIIEYEDFRRISMADLPGLIEGAYRNVGMGHRFLKHVERTPLMLFVVDQSGFQLNQISPFRNAFETVMLLNRELELYNRQLLERPAMMVINKLDLPNGKEKAQQLEEMLKNPEGFLHLIPEDLRPKKLLKFIDFISISGKKGWGVSHLKKRLRTALDEIENEKQSALRKIVLKHDSKNNETRSSLPQFL